MKQTADFELLKEARTLWSQGDREAALDRFESALQAEPDNIRALIEFARALGQCYQIARAESLLVRAATLGGGNPTVAPLIAQSYRVIHRPLRAIEALEKLQRADLLSPPLLAELAVLYEQTNRLDDAHAAIEQCLAQAPQQPEAMLTLARIQRQRGLPDVAANLLNQLLGKSNASPLLQVRCLTELSHLRDAAGDYDGAVTAIERAKALLRSSPQTVQLLQRRDAVNDALKKMSGDFTSATRDQWQAASLPSEPAHSRLAHLMGFPRSGTTLLEQILAAHPDLVASSERPVFARDVLPAMHSASDKALSLASLSEITEQRLVKHRGQYVDAMEAIHGAPLGGRVHLDKNPNHTTLVVALLRLFPQSRFLFAVRDPRDVVVSAYLRFVPLTEFSVSFLQWETLCKQYAFDMNVWLAVRGILSEQSLQIRYEDLVHDWRAEATTALRFLGLDWHPDVEKYRRRLQTKAINSPSQAAVRQPIGSIAIGRWRHYERYLQPHLSILEPYCREFGYC